MAIPVSIQLWQELVTEGWICGDKFTIRCEEGLPEGAELVNSYYDDTKGGVAFLAFRHESFEDVPVGDKIPERRIVYSRTIHNDEDA